MSPWLSDLFLRSQSDERLVALARAGQERGFAAIVERYREPLQAYARRTGPAERAEDAVQQAFMQAFAALRSGTEVRHLRGWLFQILRNVAARAAGSEGLAEIEVAGVATGALGDAVETRMVALDALAEITRLPSRQREALVGTAIQGLSRAEVAGSMGLSEGAVRQLVHRARATVRTAVSAITPFPIVRWLVARSGSGGGGVSDVAIAAGTASAGGAAVKLGALVATGVVATGVVSSQLQSPPVAHRSVTHNSVTHRVQGHERGGAGPASLLASVAGAHTFGPVTPAVRRTDGHRDGRSGSGEDRPTASSGRGSRDGGGSTDDGGSISGGGTRGGGGSSDGGGTSGGGSSDGGGTSGDGLKTDGGGTSGGGGQTATTTSDGGSQTTTSDGGGPTATADGGSQTLGSTSDGGGGSDASGTSGSGDGSGSDGSTVGTPTPVTDSSDGG